MMINENKTCVIISSYARSSNKSSLLPTTIESWKDRGYDILLYSHIPISEDIKIGVNHCLYSDAVKSFTVKEALGSSVYFSDYNLYYQTNVFEQYIRFLSLKNSIEHLLLNGYTNFIFIDDTQFLTYDIFKTLQKNSLEEDLLNKKFLGFVDQIDNPNKLYFSLFGGKVKEFSKLLKNIKTSEDFLNISKNEASFDHFLTNLTKKLENTYIEEVDIENKKSTTGLIEYDWWVDVVRDFTNEDGLFVVVFSSNFNLPGKLKVYVDEVEISNRDIETGPFYWFRYDSFGTKWRVEHLIGNNVIKSTEVTVDQIKNNVSSFFMLYS